MHIKHFANTKCLVTILEYPGTVDPPSGFGANEAVRDRVL